MSCTLQISGITGNSPYTIYVCDYTFHECAEIGVYSEPITYPLDIIVPDDLVNQSKIILKIIDSSGCTKYNLYNTQVSLTPLT